MHILKVVTGAVFLYYHLTGQFFSMILIFRKWSNLYEYIYVFELVEAPELCIRSTTH